VSTSSTAASAPAFDLLPQLAGAARRDGRYPQRFQEGLQLGQPAGPRRARGDDPCRAARHQRLRGQPGQRRRFSETGRADQGHRASRRQRQRHEPEPGRERLRQRRRRVGGVGAGELAQ
jgi:hypothetical protein